MAPSTKKPKLDNQHQYYDLTESADKFKDAVQKLPMMLEMFPDSLVILKPLLASIAKAFELTGVADISGTVYQASTLTKSQAVRYLGINYDEDDVHTWALEAGKMPLAKEKPMSPWACK